MGNDPLPPVFTVRELAAYLNVSTATIYRLLKTGQLPAFRVGSDCRFSRAEIDRWRLSAQRLTVSGTGRRRP